MIILHTLLLRDFESKIKDVYPERVGCEKNVAETILPKMVGPLGVEPSTNGLCVPLRLSPPLSGLWSGLSLVFTTRPYSLYTFPRVVAQAWLGIATSWKQRVPRI